MPAPRTREFVKRLEARYAARVDEVSEDIEWVDVERLVARQGAALDFFAGYGLPISSDTGSMALMKTTVDVVDALLIRAKRHARRTGRPLRALIEEGLRRVLEDEGTLRRYRVPDRSVGNPKADNPLDALTWPELRDEIYGGR